VPRRSAGPRHNDLFEIFPDLPGLRTRSRDEQVARMRRLLLDTRDRAAVNIRRQRMASAQVRAAVLARQHGLRRG
jgi:hypothetical protein